MVRIKGARREELLNAARGVRAEEPEEAAGWVRLEVTFEDRRHAVWSIWHLETAAEVLAPDSLRGALRDRTAALICS